MKTIAQKLNIKKFPFTIKDDNGNEIYYEDSNGFWCKHKFNACGNLTYFESSTGSWSKQDFDSKGNRILYENSNKYWEKCEYDSMGKLTYVENSHGVIADYRSKPHEGKVVEIDGIKYKLIPFS